jgi:hypothetical protein
MRQTVSVAGAEPLVELPAVLLAVLPALADEVELPELQPAIVSAAAATPAAAPSTADLFLSPTAGTPSARVYFCGQTWSGDPWHRN